MKCSCGRGIVFEDCYVIDNDNEAICEFCYRKQEKEKHQAPDIIRSEIKGTWKSIRKE
tara:strand:+ start:389 stop:562 length:174 start_codon:yes stop_codon:yes gene_type:complete